MIDVYRKAANYLQEVAKLQGQSSGVAIPPDVWAEIGPTLTQAGLAAYLGFIAGYQAALVVEAESTSNDEG